MMNNTDREERRLSAIMFSDICGFSRMMGEDEQRARRILALHNEILSLHIADYSGHIIKSTGDGLLAEFHSAVSAVKCAIAIQKHMRQCNLKLGEQEQFDVRIGVHLGDVVVSNNDIFGDGVNVASRIEPLALPGGICISQDVYNQVQNQVEMEIVSLGPRQLKNINRQVEIYRVLVAAADRKIIARESRRRKLPLKWIGIAAAAIPVVVVLVLVLAGTKRNRDAGRVAEAARKATTHIERSEGQSAIDLINNTKKTVDPETDGLEKLDALLEQARDIRERKILQRRFKELTTAFFEKDIDTCVDMATPESRMKLGDGGIRMGLGLMIFATAVGRITPGDFRIAEVDLGENRDRAEIIPEVFTKNEWKRQDPMLWHKVDGEWYFHVEKKDGEQKNTLKKLRPKMRPRLRPGAGTRRPGPGGRRGL